MWLLVLPSSVAAALTLCGQWQRPDAVVVIVCFHYICGQTDTTCTSLRCHFAFEFRPLVYFPPSPMAPKTRAVRLPICPFEPTDEYEINLWDEGMRCVYHLLAAASCVTRAFGRIASSRARRRARGELDDYGADERRLARVLAQLSRDVGQLATDLEQGI